MSDIYSIITDIAKIIGININETGIIYEYEIVTKIYDKIDNIVCHQIHKEKDKITYIKKFTEHNVTEKEYFILKSIKDVYDTFNIFINDSYYDSPILFKNLQRVKQEETHFLKHYKNKPGYFYMGLYTNNNDDEYHIYVKKNKEENYNEYIVE